MKYGDLIRLREEFMEESCYESFRDHTFVFMGEMNQMPGHCILIQIHTGKVHVGYHTDSFRLLTDDEV